MTSIFEEIWEVGRVYGVWSYFSGISHGDFSSSYTNNCSTKIMFKQDMRNLYSSIPTMDLTPDQVEDAKILGPGEAFCKCYARPKLLTFKLSIPLFRGDKSIDQGDLNKIFDPVIEKFDIEHVPEIKKKAVIDLIYREIDYRKSKLRTKNEMRYEREILKKNLPDEFLQDVVENPFSVLKERYSKLNLRPEDGKNVKDDLVISGYLESYFLKLDLEKRGRSKVFLSLTQKGMDYLINKGFWKPNTPYFQGKGGFVHALLQGDIKMKFDLLGYNTVLEEPRSAGCDVAIYSNDGSKALYAFEVSVTTSFEHEMNNMLRDLERFERVIVLTVSLITKTRTIKKKDSRGIEKQHELSYKTIDDEKSLKKSEEFYRYLRERLDVRSMKKIQVMNMKGFNYFIKSLNNKIKEK